MYSLVVYNSPDDFIINNLSPLGINIPELLSINNYRPKKEMDFLIQKIKNSSKVKKI